MEQASAACSGDPRPPLHAHGPPLMPMDPLPSCPSTPLHAHGPPFMPMDPPFMPMEPPLHAHGPPLHAHGPPFMPMDPPLDCSLSRSHALLPAGEAASAVPLQSSRGATASDALASSLLLHGNAANFFCTQCGPRYGVHNGAAGAQRGPCSNPSPTPEPCRRKCFAKHCLGGRSSANEAG